MMLRVTSTAQPQCISEMGSKRWSNVLQWPWPGLVPRPQSFPLPQAALVAGYKFPITSYITTLNNQKRVKMFLARELSQVQPSVTCSLKLSTTVTAPSNILYCYRREPCAHRLTPSLHKATVLRRTATMLSPGTACEAAHCAGKRNRAPKFKGCFPTVPAHLPWALSSHH